MRIQLASDLHLECIGSRFPGQNIISPAPGADLLVLAGDIENGVDGVRRFANWPVPVLYVLGNHESYGCVFDEVRPALKAAAEGTSVVVLDNDVADLRHFGVWASTRLEALQRVRFLGCTLWTDYELPSLGVGRGAAMEAAARSLMDHRLIRRSEGRPFTPADALSEHWATRAWLEQELSRPFDGKTVVITHHAPHRGSVHPRYEGDVVNAAFASHLPQLLRHADLWFHGHTHDSFDYVTGRCRVVANPLGYPRNRDAARDPSQLVFENPAFLGACMVDV